MWMETKNLGVSMTTYLKDVHTPLPLLDHAADLIEIVKVQDSLTEDAFS